MYNDLGLSSTSTLTVLQSLCLNRITEEDKRLRAAIVEPQNCKDESTCQQQPQVLPSVLHVNVQGRMAMKCWIIGQECEWITTTVSYCTYVLQIYIYVLDLLYMY